MQFQKIILCVLLQLLIVFSLFIPENFISASHSIQVMKKKKTDMYYERFNFKYKNASYPLWLKDLIEKDKNIITYFLNDEELTALQKAIIHNFEKNISKLDKKNIKDSYDNRPIKDLYITCFENSQIFLKSYFNVLNIIESQAFLSLAIDEDKKFTDSIITEKAIKLTHQILTRTFIKATYFYYQIPFVTENLANPQYLMHTSSLNEDITKISEHLVKLINPLEFNFYILDIKNEEKDFVSHKMEIYRQLYFLSNLAIRKVKMSENNKYELIYKDYDFALIAKSYKEIKNNLENLVSDELFSKLNEKERLSYMYIINIQLSHIRMFFKNLGHDIDPPIEVISGGVGPVISNTDTTNSGGKRNTNKKVVRKVVKSAKKAAVHMKK